MPCSTSRSWRPCGSHGITASPGCRSPRNCRILDPTELTEPQRRRIAAFGRRYGRRLSLDGPDGAASLFATSRHLRAGMLAHYRDLFDAA